MTPKGRSLSFRRVVLPVAVAALSVALGVSAQPSSDLEKGASPTLFEDDFELGNTSAWTDSIPPVLIDIVTPEDGDVTNDRTPTVTLSFLSVDGTGIDLDSLYLTFAGTLTYMDCISSQSGATCTPFVPFDNGPLAITAKIADLVGRESTTSAIDITIDTGAPTITLDAPIDGLLTGTAEVRFTGFVDEEVELFLDGDPVALDGDLRFDHLATLAEGSQTRRLTARDAAGNTDEVTRSLTLDTTAPDAIVRARLRVLGGIQ